MAADERNPLVVITVQPVVVLTERGVRSTRRRAHVGALVGCLLTATGCGVARQSGVHPALATSEEGVVVSGVGGHRTYDAPPRGKMSAPWCGLVGINFAALHLTVQSSDHLVEEAGRTLTPATGVKVSYFGSRTVRLSLPRSALGPRFKDTSRLWWCLVRRLSLHS